MPDISPKHRAARIVADSGYPMTRADIYQADDEWADPQQVSNALYQARREGLLAKDENGRWHVPTSADEAEAAAAAAKSRSSNNGNGQAADPPAPPDKPDPEPEPEPAPAPSESEQIPGQVLETSELKLTLPDAQFALWSDGTLMIRAEGTEIALPYEATRRCIRYLDRMADNALEDTGDTHA